jgi:hypothetical protein
MTEVHDRRASRLARIGALVLALCVVAAACGSDDDEATASGSASVPSLSESETDDQEDEGPDLDELEAQWADCMADNGVDVTAMIETELSSAEIDEIIQNPAYEAADEACRDIIDDAFGTVELDPTRQAELADQSVELAACGRDTLGIDIPDDILLRPDDDPILVELAAMEMTPEQEAALDACFSSIIGADSEGTGGG